MEKIKKRYIVKASEVKRFSIAGQEDIYVSRLLIDKESVGSERMVMSNCTLKPGKRIEPGIHPCPYDEAYYILKGKGILRMGDNNEQYEVCAGTVVFIPCELRHGLENTGTDDLEFLAIFPGQLKPGVNGIYDERKKKWGKSFRLIDEEDGLKI